MDVDRDGLARRSGAKKKERTGIAINIIPGRMRKFPSMPSKSIVNCNRKSMTIR